MKKAKTPPALTDRPSFQSMSGARANAWNACAGISIKMQLSQPQISAIHKRAEETGPVKGVWLFGSRAKGKATPASDVDLAIDAAMGDYVCLGDQWQSDLTDILGLKAHIKFKNAKDGRISRWCEEHGIQLYPPPCETS